jgi:hypothetical protein
MLAATPAWFANNLPQIAVGTLLVLTFLVIRLVQTVMVRTVLLGLIALVGVLVYVSRATLKACAQTCECEIGGRHITVPTCQPDLEL